MNLSTTVGFILDHPLNRGRSLAALSRFVGWQVGSRLKREHVHHWVDDAKLAVRCGMYGATGNIFADCTNIPTWRLRCTYFALATPS